MFERYTEKARRVIFVARQQAGAFGSDVIEMEHLLLGLVDECSTLVDALLGTGNAATLRRQIEARMAKEEPFEPQRELPLSDSNKRVLAYAAEEAGRSDEERIEPKHLLLGILREIEPGRSLFGGVKRDASAGGEILRSWGATIDVARERLAAPGRHKRVWLYCPKCEHEVTHPVTCGECSAVICRASGTPLESANEPEGK